MLAGGQWPEVSLRSESESEVRLRLTLGLGLLAWRPKQQAITHRTEGGVYYLKPVCFFVSCVALFSSRSDIDLRSRSNLHIRLSAINKM